MYLVVHEVKVGMGRTGKLWGCHLTDTDPDVLIIGRGVASGQSIRATVAPAEVLDAVVAGHAFTTAGAACAAAIATLDVVRDEKLGDNAPEQGHFIMGGAATAAMAPGLTALGGPLTSLLDSHRIGTTDKDALVALWEGDGQRVVQVGVRCKQWLKRDRELATPLDAAAYWLRALAVRPDNALCRTDWLRWLLGAAGARSIPRGHCKPGRGESAAQLHPVPRCCSASGRRRTLESRSGLCQ